MSHRVFVLFLFFVFREINSATGVKQHIVYLLFCYFFPEKSTPSQGFPRPNSRRWLLPSVESRDAMGVWLQVLLLELCLVVSEEPRLRGKARAGWLGRGVQVGLKFPGFTDFVWVWTILMVEQVRLFLRHFLGLNQFSG